MNLQFMGCFNVQERTIRQFVIVKQIDVICLFVCPINDNEFRHGIFKAVCGATRLAPRRSTARTIIS